MNVNSDTITLRRDIRFTLHGKGSSAAYIVEDPIRQKFYRIGILEYLFLSQIDNNSLTETVIEKTNNLSGKVLFTMAHGQATINWLRTNQLLIDEKSQNTQDHLERQKAEQKQKDLGLFNFMSIKLPLFNPHEMLKRIFPYFSWFTGNLFFATWLFVFLTAMVVLGANWQEFCQQSTSILSLSNLVWLWSAWLLLKVLHEFGHALTCYHYHGEVNEAGVLFILFFPLTYINATSSWSFPTKWQRVQTAFAGMYLELFIAAIAVLVWKNGPATIAGNFAYNIILVAGVSSVLFNANPLMRFDGYFILTDLIDIPNLYMRGKEFVQCCFSRLFLGKYNYTPHYTGTKELMVKLYGVLSWCWRILIMLSLVSIAAKMFHGFGLIIAVISLFFWLGIPLIRFLKKIPEMRQNEATVFNRLIAVCLVLAISLTLFIKNLSWHERVTAPAVVQYQKQAVIKTKETGFITQLPLLSGSKIKKGDVLLILNNPELKNELRDKQLHLQQLQLESRIELNQKNTSNYQVIQSQLQAVQGELDALEERVKNLTLFSPIHGKIAGYHVENMLGAYVNQGAEVLWVVNEEKKILQASIPQNDIDGFRGKEGQRIKVDMRLSGHGVFEGVIGKVSQVANRVINEKALSARYGGPVDVRPALAINAGNGGEQHEFFEPRFNVEIEITKLNADGLQAGQVGSIEAEGGKVTFAFILADYLTERYLN